jgi:FkbM family methyltransferase
MKLGNRPATTVLGALFKRQHYIAARNMLAVYERPLEMFSRYLLGGGSYPAVIGVSSPMGPLPITAYSSHDILSINEIFCRHDYPCTAADRVFVDFGSNIGVSAAFFLSRDPASFAYLYEPFPQNVERLKKNLAFAQGRYALNEIAIGPQEGRVQFGWEPSGRYGGVGRETGNYIEVPCRDSNTVLREIVDRHGRIDVLKIDIETLERQVVERIPDDLRSRIDRIYAEYPFDSNPLRASHSMRQYGAVAQFTLLHQAQ